MTIKIGRYDFEGPYQSVAALQNLSGVYVILGDNGNSWSVVDIGESAEIRKRVENHDRAPLWRQRGHRVLAAAICYAHERDRMLIEQELRIQFNPPCGDR